MLIEFFISVNLPLERPIIRGFPTYWQLRWVFNQFLEGKSLTKCLETFREYPLFWGNQNLLMILKFKGPSTLINELVCSVKLFYK